MSSSGSTKRQLVNGSIELTAGGAVSNIMVGHPLDTLKVKMQTYPQLYRNSFDCFKQTVVKDGWSGLYAGLRPALISDISEKSVLFFAYDLCQQSICDMRQTQECTTFDKALSASAYLVL
ncbi:unnamed protein product [Oppiella nova]|uniref:Mitochondrial carrier protein n=1 Tax=Oppiella nova TaxID=334625 RepID=A0A7R9M790_9ACAR|nr:unnamed protein product [Oppiella nova]CAG2172048.1 unnamed protein product [Oppiella nova]